ncbi:MAG: DUF1840 domain-containing protein [Sterolibacteriaceae bacterium]|uniref:DUF1840 domain-containing protein n=1 Tax=Candidatus Methylophosphatis roskildensis TaxID=2899263 RepID=A0A9D7DW01_9PROT|nr:DUF1840 domain-containing protein [Candidatus Methylophosphatis roskildensis]MBK7234146.1 DUF1840 domain-containing protein [Sterolibacteriaceae bacterium]
MIITFKSRAAGDVIQFGEVAKRLLGIIGKNADSTTGIITVEQLPDALARLKAAVAAERAELGGRSRNDDDEEQQGGPPAITLSQRAVPLIELMEYALRDKAPVTWGV